MKKSMIIFALACCMFSMIFVSTASAAWYNCQIAEIVPYSTGAVKVQVLPGTGEDRFTERSRGVITKDCPGGNKMMAVLLTAVSLGYEVKIEMADDPSWIQQPITGASLLIIE